MSKLEQAPTQRELSRVCNTASMLIEDLHKLSMAASSEKNNTGLLLHKIVMPLLKDAGEMSRELDDLQAVYNYED